MPTTQQRRQTLRQGLEDLGFDSPESFADCESRQAEFSLLKKHYHRLCRQHHPDKGGEPAQFRRIHTSYELLRDLHAGEHEELQRRPWPARWRFVDAWATTRRRSTTTTATDDNSPAQAETTFDMSAYDFNFANMETPSWEYYQDAAAEDVPPYRIELAKTGRSKCTEMGKKAKKCAVGVATNNNNADGTTTTALIDPTRAPEYIEQGEVRVGWLSEFGMYNGWKHLRCWRVPYKVWQGLPDPNHCQDAHKFHQALVTMTEVVITGYDELPATDQQAVVAHCMDRGNWAAYRKPKAEKEPEAAAAQQQETTTTDTTTETVPTASFSAKLPLAVPSSSLVPRASTALLQGRVKFATPVPGVNGASDATVFQGVRFVLTGLFPEIGGGQGLLLGKDRVKAMITAFGGRVTGSISGKTNVLVVGKEPGMSKVTQARARAAMKMCSLKDLKEGLDAGATCLEDFDFYHRKEPMMIQNFSMGYMLKSGYNGLAITASQKDLAIAHGFAARAQANDTPKPPPPPAGTASSSPVVLTIDDDDDDDDKKPAAQSPRTNAKRKALLAIANASGDEFPSESPAKAAKSSVETTTTTTNNQESKMSPPTDDDDDDEEEEEEEDVIVCDQCGEDCTAESWFLAKSEKDFCFACYGKQSARLRKVMEHQRHGQAVVKSS